MSKEYTLEDPRYWVLDSANEYNKIAEAAEATGLKLVGLVDEEAGGVVAYVVDDLADQIAHDLNLIDRSEHYTDTDGQLVLYTGVTEDPETGKVVEFKP